MIFKFSIVPWGKYMGISTIKFNTAEPLLQMPRPNKDAFCGVSDLKEIFLFPIPKSLRKISPAQKIKPQRVALSLHFSPEMVIN